MDQSWAVGKLVDAWASGGESCSPACLALLKDVNQSTQHPQRPGKPGPPACLPVLSLASGPPGVSQLCSPQDVCHSEFTFSLLPGPPWRIWKITIPREKGEQAPGNFPYLQFPYLPFCPTLNEPATSCQQPSSCDQALPNPRKLRPLLWPSLSSLENVPLRCLIKL
ncbi:hypothetical protein H1C71_021290, partial [Ictidomys tridecemlineatus]